MNFEKIGLRTDFRKPWLVFVDTRLIPAKHIVEIPQLFGLMAVFNLRQFLGPIFGGVSKTKIRRLLYSIGFYPNRRRTETKKET